MLLLNLLNPIRGERVDRLTDPEHGPSSINSPTCVISRKEAILLPVSRRIMSTLKVNAAFLWASAYASSFSWVALLLCACIRKYSLLVGGTWKIVGSIGTSLIVSLADWLFESDMCTWICSNAELSGSVLPLKHLHRWAR